MAELTITTFLTLDGVMQAPGGPDEDTSGGFTHGGWVTPHFDETTGAFMDAVFRRATAFVLGRGTYDIFAAHWPRIDDPSDPISTTLNALPKYVATRSRESLEWQNSTPVPDIVPAIRSLRQELAGELQVHGSPGLAQTLIAEDLIDVYNLLVFPVVVGHGKRLFGSGAAPAGMELVQSHATASGIVIGTYRRAGALRTGSFALDG